MILNLRNNARPRLVGFQDKAIAQRADIVQHQVIVDRILMLHNASVDGSKEKAERRQALLAIDDFIVNGIHLGIHSPVHDNKRAQEVSGIVLGDIVIEIRPIDRKNS